MPVLDGREWTQLPPVDAEPGTEVWEIRFTGEQFLDYEAYIARVLEYRRKQWSCRYTGKGKMTFEEALRCERVFLDSIELFPKFLEPLFERMMHGSRCNLSDLTDALFQRGELSFFPGEELYADLLHDASDLLFPVRIVEELTPPEKIKKMLIFGVCHGSLSPEQKEQQETMNQTRRYRVERLDEPGTYEVLGPDLFRKKPVVPKRLIKDWLKHAGHRDTKTHIWICKALSHEPVELPEDMKKEKEKEPKKRKVKEEATGPRFKTPLSIKPRDEQFMQGLFPWESVRVDDSTTSSLPAVAVPEPAVSWLFAEVLALWDFCNRYWKTLRLTPNYTVEELYKSIAFEGSVTPLVYEMVVCLLRVALDDQERIRGKMTAEVVEDLRAEGNWEKAWAEYLGANDFVDEMDAHTKRTDTYSHRSALGRMSLSDTRKKLIEEGYGALEFAERVLLLRFLVDEVCESDKIRIDVDYRAGQIISYVKEQRMLDAEDMRAMRENPTNAARYEKKIEERAEIVAREVEKLEYRGEALGRDRSGDLYWYFTKEPSGRLFVQRHALPKTELADAETEDVWMWTDDMGVVQQLNEFVDGDMPPEKKLKKRLLRTIPLMEKVIKTRGREMEKVVQERVTLEQQALGLTGGVSTRGARKGAKAKVTRPEFDEFVLTLPGPRYFNKTKQ
jgi:hypothetical protein